MKTKSIRGAFLAAAIISCLLCPVGNTQAQSNTQRNKARVWEKYALRNWCMHQSRAKIHEWFGDPDQIELSGKIWAYNGMTIKDSDSAKIFTTLILGFTLETGGEVEEVAFINEK